MATVRKTLADVKVHPPALTAQRKARLQAMSDDEMERDARSEPDAPRWTDEQLDRAAFGRKVRTIRKDLGMSQERFAAALQIPLATLRNWEQGRSAPDPAGKAL